jgi:hypothetical protein
MLRRLAPLLAVLLLPACSSSAPSGPSDDGVGPPPDVTTTPREGDDGNASPTPPGPTLGVPADVCTLLNAAEVVRAAGAKDAAPKATTQGQIRSCEYKLSTESGASGSLFLDVSDQRPAQLYEVATSGMSLAELAVGSLKAAYDPAGPKAYVLTRTAFFSLTLPTNLGTLTSEDGQRRAAEELATAAVTRIGG